MIILVRNIDRAITEEEVRKLLTKHGKVRSFDLVLDKETGLSKGFGFADMPNHEEAAVAIETLDGFQLGTEKLRVKRAASSSLLKESPRPKKNPRPRRGGRSDR
jgi:RNA recognition motif-containing protein